MFGTQTSAKEAVLGMIAVCQVRDMLLPGIAQHCCGLDIQVDYGRGIVVRRRGEPEFLILSNQDCVDGSWKEKYLPRITEFLKDKSKVGMPSPRA